MDQGEYCDMDKFLTVLQKHFPLSDQGRERLLRDMEEMTFSKGDFVVKEGEVNHYAYFVKEGFVAASVLREGKDITLWFAGVGELAVMTLGSVNNAVSPINVEVSEDSVLYRISRDKMEALFEESIELANWGRKLMEIFLMEYMHFFMDYSWINAKGQYETLIKAYPELLQKVSLKQIASYLGITPQSLSRIRAQLK